MDLKACTTSLVDPRRGEGERKRLKVFLYQQLFSLSFPMLHHNLLLKLREVLKNSDTARGINSAGHTPALGVLKIKRKGIHGHALMMIKTE